MHMEVQKLQEERHRGIGVFAEERTRKGVRVGL